MGIKEEIQYIIYFIFWRLCAHTVLNILKFGNGIYKYNSFVNYFVEWSWTSISSLAYLTSLKSTSYHRKFSLMKTICKIFYSLLYLVYFFSRNGSFIYFLNKYFRSWIYEIVWMNIYTMKTFLHLLFVFT